MTDRLQLLLGAFYIPQHFPRPRRRRDSPTLEALSAATGFTMPTLHTWYAGRITPRPHFLDILTREAGRLLDLDEAGLCDWVRHGGGDFGRALRARIVRSSTLTLRGQHEQVARVLRLQLQREAQDRGACWPRGSFAPA